MSFSRKPSKPWHQALPFKTLSVSAILLQNGMVMPATPVFLSALRRINSGEIMRVKVFGNTTEVYYGDW